MKYHEIVRKKLKISDIRKKLGLNQMDFWSRIGVIQLVVPAASPVANMSNLYANCFAHIERVDFG